MNCGACEYWASIRPWDDMGDCMFRAPVIVITHKNEAISAFPRTVAHMKACGDFQPRGPVSYQREVTP